MINRVSDIIPLNDIKIIKKEETNKDINFSDFLKKAIYEVNDAKKYQEELTQKLISGELENLHELSIARGIANVQFSALSEGISKIVDAYKEISRIQI